MTDFLPGYWPSTWPGEDGGPQRRQVPRSDFRLGLTPGESLKVTSRLSIASTMVVLREPGEVYLLCHTGGDHAISWVEQIHPETLDVIRRSPDLPGETVWPGGIAAHANGSLYVAFGRYLHRLSADLNELVSVELPRNRPYNSFIILPDGHLATKDFGGIRPQRSEVDGLGASELLVLEPQALAVVSRLQLSEPSIARLSADANDVYIVGDTHLIRVRWDGRHLTPDGEFVARYRTFKGQTYGWDAVIESGAAWFLDNGFGAEKFNGSLRDLGTSVAPLHIVRVDLASGKVSLTEVCGLSNGLIANPPAVDPTRRIVVGYDSSNGVVAAFRFDETGTTKALWNRELNHAAHPLLFADSGELVLCDFDRDRNADQLLVLRIETGEEVARVDTGSPVQSVLFGAPGFARDLYFCSITTVSHFSVTSAKPDDPKIHQPSTNPDDQRGEP